jgi:pyruvate formate-lyase activating enzyme-like uncharacterized protein
MTKPKITESNSDTYFIKNRGIPKGCKYCLKGEKTVLFLNGICQLPNHCSWYCPISKERKAKNITFANEIHISSNEELIEEIRKTKAKGMSITGGDPLLKKNFKKTIEFMNYVKSVIGKNFHIHLYTNGLDFTQSIAEELASAGLDEIRFHSPLNKWKKIKYALNNGYSVGAEFPVIPNNEQITLLEKLIIYLNDIGGDFINLNEFEYCFSNSQSLKERGFRLKDGTMASVLNSREMALELLKRMSQKVSIKLHFCTTSAKDHFQLKNRYLKRAKTIKLPYEEITEDGLLEYGQIEGNLKSLNNLYKIFLSDLRIPKKFISFEKDYITIPNHILYNKRFLQILEKFNLKGFHVEIIPFRGKYCQITEKTLVLKSEID